MGSQILPRTLRNGDDRVRPTNRQRRMNLKERPEVAWGQVRSRQRDSIMERGDIGGGTNCRHDKQRGVIDLGPEPPEKSRKDEVFPARNWRWDRNEFAFGDLPD